MKMAHEEEQSAPQRLEENAFCVCVDAHASEFTVRCSEVMKRALGLMQVTEHEEEH